MCAVIRLTTAGRFWLGYFVVLALCVVGVSSARAGTVTDDGFSLCTSLWGDCYGSGVWVRRGVGSSFVTFYRPIGSVIQCHASNEYGGGFGDLPDVDGTACYSKAAVSGEAPPAGLGFVDAVPGSGFRSPECLGGSACSSDGGASSPVPDGLTVEQAANFGVVAAVLFLCFHGYATGRRI